MHFSRTAIDVDPPVSGSVAPHEPSRDALASSPWAPYGCGRSAADPAAPVSSDDVAYAPLRAIGNGVFSRPEDIAALAADAGRRAARHGWRAKDIGLSLGDG